MSPSGLNGHADLAVILWLLVSLSLALVQARLLVTRHLQDSRRDLHPPARSHDWQPREGRAPWPPRLDYEGDGPAPALCLLSGMEGGPVWPGCN